MYSIDKLDMLIYFLSDVDAKTATVKCPTPAPPGKCKSKQDFEPTATNKTPQDNDDKDEFYGDDVEAKPHGTVDARFYYVLCWCETPRQLRNAANREYLK